MRKFPLLYGIVLAILVLPLAGFAQNLVPNPGFEKLNSCPSGGGSVAFDAGYSSFPVIDKWVNPVFVTSPDIFNVCATPGSGVHVPESFWGYQYPRTGDGYAGIIAWEGDAAGNSDWREYLQCKLLQPLNPGQTYCVTFYVNTAISSTPGFSNFNFVAIDDIGVNFSVIKPTQPNGTTLALATHVANSPGNFLSDTSAWKKVSALYTATGGEQWMTVGCFYKGGPPSKTQLYPVAPDPSKPYRAYLYFDDFSVAPIGAGDTVKRSYDTLTCKRSGFTMQLASQGEENIAWSTGASSPAINVTAPGTYWCASYYNCQFHIDTFHVVFDPAKLLFAGNDTGNCHNEPIELKTNPAGGFTNFAWSTGENTGNITVTQSGAYIVTAINECGLQRDTVNVYIQPPTAPPVVYDTTVCQFTPNPDLHITGSDINWYTHVKGIFGFPHQPVITTTQPGAFTFYVSQTVGKCESERVPLTIRVHYTPHEELADQVRMCARIPDTIGVQHDDVSYKWSTGETSCCIIPGHEGVYKVATSNECGNYVDVVDVKFDICEDCITVPNAFVPYRSETGNNLFRPIITCPVKTFRMRILNRWGNLVYDSQDPNEGWNGYYRNIAADQGVYVYLIEFRSVSTGNAKLLQGNFTLLK